VTQIKLQKFKHNHSGCTNRSEQKNRIDFSLSDIFFQSFN
jgi:hypothetical protein